MLGLWHSLEGRFGWMECGMQYVNVSIDAGDRRVFEEEFWTWEKARPRPPGALGHSAMMPAMSGPWPDGRCNYMRVPEPFLEVLKTKGFSYRGIA